MSKFIVTFNDENIREILVAASRLYINGPDYELQDSDKECIAIFGSAGVLSIVKLEALEKE